MYQILCAFSTSLSIPAARIYRDHFRTFSYFSFRTAIHDSYTFVRCSHRIRRSVHPCSDKRCSPPRPQHSALFYFQVYLYIPYSRYSLLSDFLSVKINSFRELSSFHYTKSGQEIFLPLVFSSSIFITDLFLVLSQII